MKKRHKLKNVITTMLMSAIFFIFISLSGIKANADDFTPRIAYDGTEIYMTVYQPLDGDKPSDICAPHVSMSGTYDYEFTATWKDKASGNILGDNDTFTIGNTYEYTLNCHATNPGLKSNPFVFIKFDPLVRWDETTMITVCNFEVGYREYIFNAETTVLSSNANDKGQFSVDLSLGKAELQDEKARSVFDSISNAKENKTIPALEEVTKDDLKKGVVYDLNNDNKGDIKLYAKYEADTIKTLTIEQLDTCSVSDEYALTREKLDIRVLEIKSMPYYGNLTIKFKTTNESTSDQNGENNNNERTDKDQTEIVDTKLNTTKIVKIKADKNSITLKWKKQTKGGIKGYKVQYSPYKSFKKGTKSVTINKTKKTSKTIKKLKSGKKYYVRIRTFRKSGNKKIYSKWSKVKSVRVK